MYHIMQEWTDGDICEITGKPRSVMVEYHCGQEEKVCYGAYIDCVNTGTDYLSLQACRLDAKAL